MYYVFHFGFFNTIRYIRYHSRQFEAEATPFGDVFPESRILSDFVVAVRHVYVRVTQPEFNESIRACRVVPKVRVAEAAECMISRLVGFSKRVDVADFLESLVWMTADDVRL